MSNTINTGNGPIFPNSITGVGTAIPSTGVNTRTTANGQANSYELSSGSGGTGALHNPPFVADFGPQQNGPANSGAAKVSWLSGAMGPNGTDMLAGQAVDSDTAASGQTGNQLDTIGQQQDSNMEEQEDNPQVKAAAEKLMKQASQHGCGTSDMLQMSLSKSLGISFKDAGALVREMGKGGDLGQMVATAIVLHDTAEGKGPGRVKGLQVPSEALQEGDALLKSQPEAERQNTADEIKANDDNMNAGMGMGGFAQQTLQGYGSSVLSEGYGALQQGPERPTGSYQA